MAASLLARWPTQLVVVDKPTGHRVLKPTSVIELDRLMEVELLPLCDPRLSTSIPSTSVYFGINQVRNLIIENATQLAAQSSSGQQHNEFQKAIGPAKDCDTARDGGMHHSQEYESELHRKSRVRTSSPRIPSTQSNVLSLKQSASGSRRHRAAVKDVDSSFYAVESVNEKLPVAASPSIGRHRTGTKSKEHESKRSVARAPASRKRKRREAEELTGRVDRFPSMDFLLNNEMAFSQHLPQLSFFAEVENNPDDPMLLISLCELDDITSFQRQDFISDLNSAFIGRKPRFTCVHSPYCDRSSVRLGQLSLQTYCDGHFIDCGPVSRVHMACLHQWALREPLEKVIRNIWGVNPKTAVNLPYPSVYSLCDIVCYWLSSQLSCFMSDLDIEYINLPDIFIGSSLQSELTVNCLHQMFCRYVNFLCEKAEKYFEGVSYGKAARRTGKHTARGVEPETGASAAHGGKPAKLPKKASSSLRSRDLYKEATKRSYSWQENVEYGGYEDVSSELERCGLLEDNDLEQMMPLHEKARFNDDLAERDSRYDHGKRKLPGDYYDDREHEMSDVKSKARRVHRDHHTRLSAREKENEMRKHDRKRERARPKDRERAKSRKQNTPLFSVHEDSPDFMFYDEDGSIIVQCSDTGRTVLVDKAKSADETSETKLKSAVDMVPPTVSTSDELCQSNRPLYAVVLHDHCYTPATANTLRPDIGWKTG